MGIFQSMGTSETLAYSINTSPRLDKKGSAGLPIGECRVRIGEDDSSPVGEIQVWQPDLDWHATGDSGMLDAEGYLWYLGREGYHGGDPLRWRSQLEEINGWVEVQEAALLGKSAFLVVQNQCHWPEILQRLALLELQGNFLSEMPRVAGGKTDLLALARLLLR